MKTRLFSLPVAVATLVLLAGCAGVFTQGQPNTTARTPETVEPTTTEILESITTTQQTTSRVGIRDAELDSFVRTGIDCDRNPRTLRFGKSTTTDTIVISVQGRVRVNDTAVVVKQPRLVKTGATTYRLNIESHAAETVGRSCLAEAGYEATVLLPNLAETELVVSHNGETTGSIGHQTESGETSQAETKTGITETATRHFRVRIA
ncbi:hypothetical protein [Haladaptatus caseinilyticus]|uniref:hypothetical protein n=1 Tax=Haladaptatus caseinilyticus TaxID=2993314 RepID=UPI00224B0B70|nr:hypothetical protein [Haladaptatus caseinilyticus]